MKKLTLLILRLSLILGLIALSSCNRKVKICASADSTGYLVGDTIYFDAGCSENAESYNWVPREGLLMIGNGQGPTERFIVEPLNGILSRSVDLTVSNSKTSRSRTESVVVF